VVYTCGTAYPDAVRAFLTGLVDSSRITTLFTAIAVIGSVASMAVSPLLGLTFSAGIGIGGMAIGLPFFVAAAVYVVGAVGLWVIRVKPRLQEAES
jgi:hypothetical protein